ncbi:hypothetical protein HID58_000554 [Brassica napus]|uniref:Uncharacterized protein n=1 Tax=Brassica napus TaxID=3708 RepID=A0ABQ8EGW7_BRANA|nr:hypothetical protein HID58_000554 [Brassica napus]
MEWGFHKLQRSCYDVLTSRSQQAAERADAAVVAEAHQNRCYEDDKAAAPEDKMVVKEPEKERKQKALKEKEMDNVAYNDFETSIKHYSKKALGRNRNMKSESASSCREREAARLRIRQEKALHLDGSEKGPDATHCSHRIKISGSENSAASDYDPLQQAHPLETTTAHVLPPCGGSSVEELLVLAFECLLKKAHNT